MSLSIDEKQAVFLYAVLGRDFQDFLDYIKEDNVTVAALTILYQMLTQGDINLGEADAKLNEIWSGPVLRQLLSRGVDPRPNIYTHILEDQ